VLCSEDTVKRYKPVPEWKIVRNEGNGMHHNFEMDNEAQYKATGDSFKLQRLTILKSILS